MIFDRNCYPDREYLIGKNGTPVGKMLSGGIVDEKSINAFELFTSAELLKGQRINIDVANVKP